MRDRRRLPARQRLAATVSDSRRASPRLPAASTNCFVADLPGCVVTRVPPVCRAGHCAAGFDCQPRRRDLRDRASRLCANGKIATVGSSGCWGGLRAPDANAARTSTPARSASPTDVLQVSVGGGVQASYCVRRSPRSAAARQPAPAWASGGLRQERSRAATRPAISPASTSPDHDGGPESPHPRDAPSALRRKPRRCASREKLPFVGMRTASWALAAMVGDPEWSTRARHAALLHRMRSGRSRRRHLPFARRAR